MYKCKICGKKYTDLSSLYNHIEQQHSEMIPMDMSIQQYYYYMKTGRSNGNCVMCKQPTTWNKNTNKYLLEQQYSANSFKQVVREPSNIEGLEIIYENNNLKINNTKLNLSNIYENYNYIAGNFLSLDSFIEDYKKEKESQSKNYAIKSENNYVIMEVKPSNGNKYASYKKIYIDRNTGNIAKLVIQDINKKNLVYILYNKIEINS